MKYKMSCSGANLAKTSSLEESIDILSKSGYDAVDFWLYIYSQTENAPLKQDNWREWAAQTREKLASAGLFAGQAHCEWHHCHCFKEGGFEFDPPEEIYHRSVEACAIIGSPSLIFHPLYYIKPMTDEKTRMAILDANVEWMRYLLPTAEKFGVELHLENTFDFRHAQRPGDPTYMCCMSREMKYMAEKLNHPLVKICLDTGHANLAGQDIPAMIRDYGDLLASLHLNDNLGVIGPIYEDIHLYPGYGKIEWDPIFQALKEIGYKGTLNLEPNGELQRISREERILQLDTARRITMLMAERNGMEV